MMIQREQLTSISILLGVLLVLNWEPTPLYIIAGTVAAGILLLLYIMVYGGE